MSFHFTGNWQLLDCVVKSDENRMKHQWWPWMNFYVTKPVRFLQWNKANRLGNYWCGFSDMVSRNFFGVLLCYMIEIIGFDLMEKEERRTEQTLNNMITWDEKYVHILFLLVNWTSYLTFKIHCPLWCSSTLGNEILRVCAWMHHHWCG